MLPDLLAACSSLRLGIALTWLMLCVLSVGAVRAQSVGVLTQRGIQYFEARQYFQAIAAFQEALGKAEGPEKETVRKNLASAYGALGAEYFNSGETRLAEENFHKGLQHADNYYSHFGLGYLLFQRRQDDQALVHLKAALVQEPGFAGTHKLLALVDYRQGRNESALERLEEAFRLDPRDTEAELLLRRWRAESKFLASCRESSSRHFALRTDPALPERAVRSVTARLERAYEEIGDGLGLWPSSPTTVVLFTEESFYRATGSYHWVGGMYDGQLKLPVPEGDLSTGPARERLDRVIRHEYAHVLVGRLAPECPVWLNEGIAQHFEEPGSRDAAYAQLREERERRVPFDQIPARLWAVADVELARWSYLQGLGLVEYLVTHHHEFRLRLLLTALAKEHSVERAFERTYGVTREKLEERFWSEVDAGGEGVAPGSRAQEQETPAASSAAR